MKIHQAAAALLLSSVVAACGSATPKQAGATPPAADASADAPAVDAHAVTDTGAAEIDSDTADVAPRPTHGTNSTTYPAFIPFIGQIENQLGGTVATPEIVTVTWAADPDATTYEAFGDKIGESKYWKTSTAEYAIGVATSGTADHVRMSTTLPATMSVVGIENLVATYAAGLMASGPDGGPEDAGTGAVPWPAPTANTLYTLFIPPTTTVLWFGSDACLQIGGYHDTVMVGDLPVPFAVVLECAGSAVESTQSASHEIIEATTDPNLNNPGWIGYDLSDIAWDLFLVFTEEIADGCEMFQSSSYTDTEPTFPFGVQRIWSNKSAAAGHNPCVPLSGDAYYNVTLLEPESVTLDLSSLGLSATYGTKGIRILPGQTKTFPIGFYSDAPTAPWTISAFEGPLGASVPPSHLSVTMDVNQGQNGNEAYVSVTVNSVGELNGELVWFMSSLEQGAEGHYMPILISSQ